MAKRILILDDDQDIRYFCSVIFESLDFDVVSSSKSENILELVAKVKPDLILIDNRMPVLAGSEATKVLKSNARFKKIPVILFSAGHDLEEIAQKAKADAYLKKPFDLSDIEHLVCSLLKMKPAKH
ncbi:response regulator [Olivibacter sp. CPCC 100613]|uniref:response regulator n=1 Tax=Olivibacter sp. CPCC 100613 TaxID=3079931 RepID=UPI002FF49615